MPKKTKKEDIVVDVTVEDGNKEVTVEVMPDDVEEEINPADIQTVESLFDQYNIAKTKSSEAITSLTNTCTLEGMDSINVLVTDAMKKIQDFATNGKPKSAMSKVTSRSLAVIDPNNSWAGKWLGQAKDHVEEEKLKEKTINQVIDLLVTQINEKKDEVIEYIGAASIVKTQMLESVDHYKELLAATQLVIKTADDNTKEFFDAEQLQAYLTITVEGIQSDIKSQVDPLIGGAKISVRQIAAILPTIENDLKYKSGFKAFQQKLSDLNGIVKTTVELAANAGDVIRKEVNDTIYQSLEMIGETGLDTKRLEKIHKEEKVHQAKIAETMNKTQNKMQNTFTEIKALSHKLEHAREEDTNKLLASYAQVD